jgi:hypothetical protein
LGAVRSEATAAFQATVEEKSRDVIRQRLGELERQRMQAVSAQKLRLSPRPAGRGPGQHRSPARPRRAEPVAQPRRPPRGGPRRRGTPEPAVAAVLAAVLRWAGDFPGRYPVQ